MFGILGNPIPTPILLGSVERQRNPMNQSTNIAPNTRWVARQNTNNIVLKCMAQSTNTYCATVLVFLIEARTSDPVGILGDYPYRWVRVWKLDLLNVALNPACPIHRGSSGRADPVLQNTPLQSIREYPTLTNNPIITLQDHYSELH